MEKTIKISGILAEFRWFEPILKALPFATVKDALEADRRINDYGREAIENAINGDIKKQNVFSRLIAQWSEESDKAKVGALTNADVAFEAGGFIVAGSGTTAVTLTYLVWAVLTHPEVQQKLEAEVAGLDPNYKDADLEKLPYLSAVIEETLRLYGAAPGSLPRRTPKGGFTLGNKYFVPEGTTVSSQAYTLHRDENVYPQAQRYESQTW